MKTFLIHNAKIVIPSGVIHGGSLLIENGFIKDIFDKNIFLACKKINACSSWIIPGLIDLHNDALEKEIEPRPETLFPFEMAFHAFENRLISHGITSIFHSLSFMEGSKKSIRSPSNFKYIVKKIKESKNISSIRHFIHARYEITDTGYVPLIEKMIKKRMLNLLSFMDHTPGQGQYKNTEYLKMYLKKAEMMTDEQIDIHFEKIMKKSAEKNKIIEAVDKLAALCMKRRIPTASHDDDTPDKIIFMKNKGITISEFPINMETSIKAKEEGLYVLGGAPNIIRGRSASGNMKIIDGIMNKSIDCICSDYAAFGMLNAVFIMHNKYSIPIHDAVNTASLMPAKASGLDSRLGSISIGKKADFVIVSEYAGLPQVERVFINGRQAFRKIRKRTALKMDKNNTVVSNKGII